jgi:ABC-2 type transport system permease protein
VIRLLHSELLKLRTTRTLTGITVASVGMTLLFIAAVVSSARADGTLGTVTTEHNVMSAVQISQLFVLLLGVLVATAEVRHGTVANTLLASPNRRAVVGVKAAVAVAGGVVVAGATAVVALAAGVGWLASEGVAVDIGEHAGAIAAAVVGIPLFAAIGVGVGALLRNQTVAVVAALAWVLAVEALMAYVLPGVGSFLPIAALDAFAGTGTLPVSSGAVLLAFYAIGLPLAGAAVFARSDVR